MPEASQRVAGSGAQRHHRWRGPDLGHPGRDARPLLQPHRFRKSCFPGSGRRP